MWDEQKQGNHMTSRYGTCATEPVSGMSFADVSPSREVVVRCKKADESRCGERMKASTENRSRSSDVSALMDSQMDATNIDEQE